MNTRFPVLSTVSSLLKVAGWLVVGAGILYAAYEGILEPNKPGHSFSGEDLMQLVTGTVFGIVGLITVALSEVIGVLFAIEENTRTNRP